MSIRGIEMHYYAVCHRKLWLFHRGIGFESQNDRVQEGKVLHDEAYGRLQKELHVDDSVLDAVDGDYIREVKLTSRMQQADRLQLLYYLYILQNRGIEKKGLLSYTKEKKTEEVILDECSEKEVQIALDQIPNILAGPIPGLKRLSYCAKCAYYDFCFSGEGDMDES
jgi:CRISPR-associated exonuclease Cas4